MPDRRHGLRLAGAAVLVLTLSGCATSRDFSGLKTPEEWRAAMQAPLSATEETMLSDGPSLHDALVLALLRSPGVAAARERWLAAVYREPQASSLPDPMLSGKYLLDSEPQMARSWTELEAMQPLPWWQKLWAMRRIAATDADIARLRYEAAARDLIIDVKDACYELYYLDQALVITERIETLFRNQALLAYSQLDTGRTVLAEGFRAENQAAQLGYDRILLGEQRAAQAERLRSLLNLPPGSGIGTIRQAPVYALSRDLPDLYRRAEAYSEMLRVKGLEIERAEYEAYLAQLSRLPDFSLGAMLERAGGGLDDMLLGLVAANLPIWEQRNRALVRERDVMAEAMRREALDEANRVRQMAAEAYFSARLSQRLAQLYAETLLPQAEAVMRQAEIDFRADLTSFSSVLETTIAYHNFALSYYRARADYGQAVGRLERVLGTTAGEGPQP
ncbi:TolC family protein [bacterium]|nr:TolC family protein [bacterium]